jgi:hypothetical protein
MAATPEHLTHRIKLLHAYYVHTLVTGVNNIPHGFVLFHEQCRWAHIAERSDFTGKSEATAAA